MGRVHKSAVEVEYGSTSFSISVVVMEKFIVKRMIKERVNNDCQLLG